LITLAEEITLPVNNVETEAKKQIPLTKEKILKEYKEVFEGLGHIGNASSFVVDQSHPPTQHAPRRIAVALKKEVKEKIDELEKKGIIKKEQNQQNGSAAWS
jgi:hypothetical protein